MRYPLGLGITGKAALKQKIAIVQIGEKDPSFASEIDNFHAIGKVTNMLVAPFHDSKGINRGVIQLINK